MRVCSRCLVLGWWRFRCFAGGSMRVACGSFAAFLLLTLALVSGAQAPSPQQAVSKPAAPKMVVRPSTDELTQAQAPACPVSLDVRHGTSWARWLPAGQSDKPARKAQALDVTVVNRGSSEIVSLDVMVQLRSGKLGRMPLVSEGETLGERLPLHVAMSVKADEDAAASWSVASTQPVAYVEISKVTYGDGSIWAASKASACQFMPSPVMLITSR